MAEILVADDEEIMREMVAASLTRLGHKVKLKRHGLEAWEAIEAGTRFDLLISDLKMPNMTGLELAEKVMAFDPQASMILMTAYGTVEDAVKAMKLGVQDFIEKPFTVEMLEHTVAQVLSMRELRHENRRLKEALGDRFRIIGDSRQVGDLLKTVDEVAGSNSTILITGESGTGKELFAQTIHQRSKRAGQPFIKVNCAAIPENLVESELFGHEKGAYTGAVRTRAGKFELAHGGTILLDEIGEMPLYAQAKLLRAIQEREITKVGGDTEVAVDVRIVSTTNRDLRDEVQKGNFREDLFFRLNVIPLRIPPLRERPEDLPALVDHFIGKYNRENGFSVPCADDQAMTRLRSHGWPGNIRELENVIQRAVVFSKHRPIQEQDLRLDSDLRLASGSSKGSDSGFTLMGMTVADAEKKLILQTLDQLEGNRTRTADVLGISIRTLRNKLHEYKLPPG